MATRIFLFKGSGIGTSYTVVNTVDGDVKLAPSSGVKWTVVEVRPLLSAAGEWKAHFDTEKYWNGRKELDFGSKGVPHTVALDLVQPHFLQLMAKADSGTLDATFEVVVEESPAA